MKSLQEIYTEHASSDGHGDKGTTHSYIDYYATVLDPYRSTKNNVLEIGVKYGNSMRMWREYFPDARIIGLDIVDNNVDCPGCEIKISDATDPNTFTDYDNIDVVIDDGSHEVSHQLASFHILWPKLNPGGVYIIEDVRDVDWNKNSFLALHPTAKIFDFRPIKNRADDVIIEIRK
jgi:trans-aconitate methyltransferase